MNDFDFDFIHWISNRMEPNQFDSTLRYLAQTDTETEIFVKFVCLSKMCRLI